MSLDVVHKHRFGSCKGRLIATPQGIRYETTEKDDAFAGALLDIEAFDVDYLAKNLRVQFKKGESDTTSPIHRAMPITCSCSIATWRKRASA